LSFALKSGGHAENQREQPRVFLERGCPPQKIRPGMVDGRYI